GKSAHAGVEPEKGANAIVQLARLVDLAAGLNGVRPGVTVNAGVIVGGRLTNVVPDAAEAHFDVRARDPEGAAAVHAALYALAEQITVPGTQATVTGGFEGQPMPRTPGNAWLAETAAAIGRALGFAVKDGPMTGGMGDANYLAEGGLPVLDGLGPIGGADHSPDEYLVVSSIAPRIALAAGVIAAACDEVDTLRGFRGQPAR
ncbi:MAG TPA: M20/M25/M40 family metallo-hydrolase, partial [Anaerolineae bacterium]